MKKIIITFVLLFSIVSCKQNDDSAINEIKTSPPTKVVLLPSATSTLVAESTKTPILDTKEFTVELIETNNGCKLPCWWGITPNQTKWSEVKSFLDSFSIINTRKTPDWFVYLVRSPIDEEISSVREIWSTFGVQDDFIKVIEIVAFNEKTYYLNNFLQSTGKPDAILISSYSSDAGIGKDAVPLSIALYYPKLGILALYSSRASTSGNTITACFEAGPHLFLWSPNSSGKYAIEDFLSWDKENIPHLSIEKSTNLTIETFYEKYSNTKGELCLQTPRDLWTSQ
jgi:hypothetical protein